ncbi:MAG: phage portal protein [Pigmentiphaga sp.]
MEMGIISDTIARLGVFLLGISGKASRGFAHTGVWRYNEPQWSGTDYHSLISNGYKRAVWAYAAINWIATAVASVPWKTYEVAAGGSRTEIADHPLTVLLRDANPYMTGQELIEIWAICMAAAGNAYWEIAGGQGRRAKEPQELYPLRPDRMQIVPSKEEYIAGYVYRVSSSEKIPYEPHEIMHTKFWDPLDSYYGLSPAQVALYLTDTDNAAIETQKIIFDNRAHADGILAPEEPMSLTEFERWKEQWEEAHGGHRNWFKPGFSNIPMRWTPLMLSSADLQLMELRRMTREDIVAGIYNLQPMVFGIGQTTYHNVQEAQRAAWEQTVIPRYLDRLKQKINAELAPRYGDRPKIEVSYDLSNVPALRENFTEVVNNAEKLFRMGFTGNEINRRLELGFDEKPWRDHWWVSPMLIPVGGSGEKSTPPGLPAGTKAAANKSGMTEEDKVAYWKRFDETLQRYEFVMRTEWQRIFEEQMNDVLEKLAALAKERSRKQAGDVFDREYWIDVVTERMMDVFRQITLFAGAEEAVRQGIDFDVGHERVRNWIMARANQLAYDTSDTTYRAIQETLAEGERLGEGYDELRQRVREVLGPDASGVYKNRPEVIARTEVHGAVSHAHREAILQTEEQTGKQMTKTWLTSRDNRVRDSHEQMDGESRLMNEPYSNGLMFPGDPDGPARETVQCRCTEIFEEKKGGA